MKNIHNNEGEEIWQLYCTGIHFCSRKPIIILTVELGLLHGSKLKEKFSKHIALSRKIGMIAFRKEIPINPTGEINLKPKSNK